MDNSTGKPTYDELLALVEAMRAENAALKERVDQLERELAAAKKTSRNSSKPPSSDITKPPKTKPKGRRKRKTGAQHGHPKHSRPDFTPEQIDNTVEHAPDLCPECGGKLEDDGHATVLHRSVVPVAARQSER